MQTMADESYDDWRRLASSWELAGSNRAPLEACVRAARASGEAQPCTIEVLTFEQHLVRTEAEDAATSPCE